MQQPDSLDMQHKRKRMATGSLQISLLTGMSHGEWFVAGCAHRH
jgi:hypothetical protein